MKRLLGIHILSRGWMIPRFISTCTLVALLCLTLATWATAQKVIELKFSHVNPPAHPSHAMGLKFAETAERLSNGRLKISVVPGGQLGGLKDTIDSARLGLPIVTYTVTSIAQDYSKKVSIFDAAYMFDTVEHQERFRNGPGGEMIWNELERAGLKRLYDSFFGPRHLWLRRPGTKPEDFSGMKLRVAPGRIQIYNVRALGLTPTPIDFPETWGALQAGTVDGVDVVPSSFLASKFADAGIRFVILTDHNHVLMTAFMSKKLFDGLDLDLQKALIEAGRVASKYHTELTHIEENRCIEILTTKHGLRSIGKEQGLDIKVFQNNARKIVWPEFRKDWGQELLDLVDRSR